MTKLELSLDAPPSSWDKTKEFKIHHRLSHCTQKPIEQAGTAFLARLRRHRHKRTLCEDIAIEQALMDAAGDDISLEEDEPETQKLLRSDPSKWKEQDHYAVLGLSKLRFKASDDDIKRAYRRKVLKHHPDKKAAGGKLNDDSFFKCIQKAWEVLSDKKKRREWDSCDPEFDDSIPSAKLKGDFFKIYQPVFEKEARFSRNNNVPELGDLEASREEVEAFYDFWFSFDSWRTFEMMDEEDADGADGREEKRYLDRKNKAARSKLKKEDNSRVNRLVEQAFAVDPRILLFKKAEKEAKDAKKREKELIAKQAEMEAAKKLEEERLRKETEDAAEKEKMLAEKAIREQFKNAVRKEKKAIKRMLRDNNNFLPIDASPDATILQITKLDYILEHNELEHLEQFRSKLDEAFPLGIDALLLVFDEEHLCVEERVSANASQSASQSAATKMSDDTAHKENKPDWSPKELSILIKAVKMFPGGASARWEKISEYILEHGGEEGESEESKQLRLRSPKQCILKSKYMQTAAAADRTRMQMASTKPANKVEIKETPSEREQVVVKQSTASNSDIKSEKMVTEQPQNGDDGPTMLTPTDPSWTNEQQLALEQALRKYPASQFMGNVSERWEKVATEVPGKNTKEVKSRVKRLAEMVKKKNKK